MQVEVCRLLGDLQGGVGGKAHREGQGREGRLSSTGYRGE